MAYSYLIETTEALFLVDGGMAGTGRKILKRIAEIGRKPEHLLFALVTHAHADHFGGLAEVQEASDCAIICHPSHADTVRTGGAIVSPGLNVFGKIYEGIAKFALPKIQLPSLRRVFSVEDGATLHRLGLPGHVLYTPGHSTGDLTLVLDDGSAFVGDLVQGRRIPGITPPEFSIMAVDEPAMLASWRVLLQSGAKVLYPGHGRIVTIDDIVPVFRRAVARAARRARRSAAAIVHSHA
jgi:glyoxylase-like metal-dependent hydrolase (beta-lactamase superfamily II)